MFPSFIVRNDIIRQINSTIGNKQYKIANEIVVYIKNNNYRGEDYTYRRGLQIDSSEFWLQYFLDKSISNDFRKFVDIVLLKNEQYITNMSKYIIE